MNMIIKEMPPCRIAYIRRIGAYGAGNSETMERLKAWAGSQGLMGGGSVILGIARDNPELTNPDKCRYDACLVLSEFYTPDDKNIRLGKITGGKYGVFQLEHTAESLERGWREIFPALSNLGQEPDAARPILERYRQELVEKHLCEICVPLI